MMAKRKEILVNCPLCERNGDKPIRKVTKAERKEIIEKFNLAADGITE